MSKERELLKRWFNDIGIIQADIKLLRDTQALLTKPEQKPEQEPVAWMYDHQIEVGYDKYTEVNIIETCARNLESNNCINIRPLYLAPPKRESLGLEIMDVCGSEDYREGFKDGALYAEKCHGIGGGE